MALMPLSDDYGFAKKYAWVSDRYGITWQLKLDW
jgi:predicted 3-demethylubiquinone-9 3-methyltransferase (glyoxalase superfamily)